MVRERKVDPAIGPGRLPGGAWPRLFTHALRLIDEIGRRGTSAPLWTFGGGTVLMLRYRHRRSKDIDIFVPDRQYLAYVTPRLSGLAEEISSSYVEAAGFVKLILPEGEIDIVAAANLTSSPFDVWRMRRRDVRVETACEIMGKKMWHRGDTVTARDLFDLSLVIEHERRALAGAGRYVIRHREAFLAQLDRREAVLRAQFGALDVMTYRPTFDEAVMRVAKFLRGLRQR